MKTTTRFLLAALALVALAFTTGCRSLPAKLQKFDELGIKEATIPGRITTTKYTKQEKNGVITSTLTHSNPWMHEPAVIVRERPAAAK